MKKILISGLNSYIGTNVSEWLNREPDKYNVNFISLKNENWRDHDFSQYDVAIHVAGIVHIKEGKEDEDLYFKINSDLTYEFALKSKLQGIRQFIFLSSMSVYGVDKGVINTETLLKPKTAYGKSKLEAEKLINTLSDDTFAVTIIRPPMVYGKNCKGNYTKLSKFAQKIKVFPDIENKRSMIYITNLAEFIRKLIDNQKSGLFFPQNLEYVSTGTMVKLISEIHGKKTYMTKLFNPLLKLFDFPTYNKVFGSLIYTKNMSHFEMDYNVFDFEESIKITEAD